MLHIPYIDSNNLKAVHYGTQVKLVIKLCGKNTGLLSIKANNPLLQFKHLNGQHT